MPGVSSIPVKDGGRPGAAMKSSPPILLTCTPWPKPPGSTSSSSRSDPAGAQRGRMRGLRPAGPGRLGCPDLPAMRHLTRPGGCIVSQTFSGANGLWEPGGSQRAATPGDARPRPATEAAGELHTRPRPATCGDTRSMHGMQEARGSNPHSSTQVTHIIRTLNR